MANGYQRGPKVGLAEAGELLHMRPAQVYEKAQAGELHAAQLGTAGRMFFTQQALQSYASQHSIKLAKQGGETLGLFEAAEAAHTTPRMLLRDAKNGNVAYMGTAPTASAKFSQADLDEYSRFRRGTDKLL